MKRALDNYYLNSIIQVIKKNNSLEPTTSDNYGDEVLILKGKHKGKIGVYDGDEGINAIILLENEKDLYIPSKYLILWERKHATNNQ